MSLTTAGRLRRSSPVLVEQFVTLGTREDAARAAELWRFLPKAFKSYFDIRDPRVIEQRATSELPIDEVIADWVVSLDPAVHAQRVVDLLRGGATIVNVHSGQPDQKKLIEAYGNEVLPRVASALSAA